MKLRKASKSHWNHYRPKKAWLVTKEIQKISNQITGLLITVHEHWHLHSTLWEEERSNGSKAGNIQLILRDTSMWKQESSPLDSQNLRFCFKDKEQLTPQPLTSPTGHPKERDQEEAASIWTQVVNYRVWSPVPPSLFLLLHPILVHLKTKNCFASRILDFSKTLETLKYSNAFREQALSLPMLNCDLISVTP